jgi:hypothetical protein
LSIDRQPPIAPCREHPIPAVPPVCAHCACHDDVDVFPVDVHSVHVRAPPLVTSQLKASPPGAFEPHEQAAVAYSSANITNQGDRMGFPPGE